ncbi:MAG: fumarate hydratase [Oscillospiraceae bacterium]|nr:fumarate hydratase [Oscillospiraceae bacterium]
MKIITEEQIASAVAGLCIRANTSLPADVQNALDKARKTEPWPLAAQTLELLWDNLDIAKGRGVPICQDTGSACVFCRLGNEVKIEGSLERAVNEGVRRGYTDGYLRKSIVGDPLRRVNTEDNTPAFLHLDLVEGDELTITVMPKGGGAENMSRLAMLKPADGVEGVKRFVVETVKLAGSNPCPPIILGVGIGGTFDQVAGLAKKALLRPLDMPHPDPFYAQLEKELLELVNAVGVGPQGFGGQTTALGLAIETLPTHVASLPVAVNINCHVTRRATAVL